MALEIYQRDYSFEEFLHVIFRVGLPAYSRLKTVCYFTKYRNWDEGEPSLYKLFEKNKVVVEDYGEIKKIKAYYYDRRTNENIEVVFYGRLNPEARVLFCVTIASMTGINRTLDRIARDVLGFYHLPIGAATFDIITDYLIRSDKNTKCTYFSASHSPWSTIEGEVRTKVDRTTIYYGYDGFQSLKELKEFYGVLPKTMRYDVPKYGIFEVKNNGCLTLMSEKDITITRHKLFELSELIIKDVLLRRNVIDSANFSIIPIQTEARIIQVPKNIPWIYKFSKKLKDEYLELLLEGFLEDEFTLFNHAKFEGDSFILSGMIYDEKKHNIFSIHVDNSQIIVAPSKEPQFDSFLRFYETLEYFDPDGKVQLLME